MSGPRMEGRRTRRVVRRSESSVGADEVGRVADEGDIVTEIEEDVEIRLNDEETSLADELVGKEAMADDEDGDTVIAAVEVPGADGDDGDDAEDDCAARLVGTADDADGDTAGTESDRLDVAASEVLVADACSVGAIAGDVSPP